MRRGIVSLYACFAACVFFLAGCGARAGQEADEASVSGASAGGRTITARTDGSCYTYCSGSKLYYIENCYAEDAVLVECDRKSGEKRRLSIPQPHQICYADNSWVYYTTWAYRDGTIVVEKVWRIPVDKTSYQADETAAELVLKSEDKYGLVQGRVHVGTDYRGVLCDGKYIVYCEESGFQIYDIAAGEYRQAAENIDDTTVEKLILRNGNLVFWDNDAKKLRCLHLDAETEAVAATGENYDSDEYGAVSSVGTATNEDIYWSFGVGGKNGKESKNGGIRQYHFADDSSILLISTAEIQALLDEEGVTDCACGAGEMYEDGIFVSRNRLYAQIAVRGKKVHCRHCFVVSKAIGKPDDALRVEKELNRWLMNPKERQKAFVKKYDGIYGEQPRSEKSVFKNRGFIMAMTDDACLMCLENADEKKNRLACCYFDGKKEPEFVTKKEAAGLLYLYDRENTIVTGDSGQFREYLGIEERMPNNYGVESMTAR